MLQAVGIIDLCGINNSVPGNLEERGSHAVGTPRPIHCSRNTLFKSFRTAVWKCGGEPSYMNRKKHTHALSADPHLPTALEWHFLGNRSTQSQSGAVDKSSVPEVCLSHCYPIHLQESVTGAARLLSPGDRWSLLFGLEKTLTKRICNNEYSTGQRWFVHLEFFSKSDNHCSDVQRPKTQGGHVEHFL